MKKLSIRAKYAIFAIVGLLLSIPWVLDVFSEKREVYMSLATFCHIIMAMIGLPMMFKNLFQFMFANQGATGPAADTTAIDVARIRHSVENSWSKK